MLRADAFEKIAKPVQIVRHIVQYSNIHCTTSSSYSREIKAQGVGTITPRELTLGTVAAQSKIYDGTTSADTSKFSAALGNTVAGDSVTATASGAAYNDKNIAEANAVNYTGVALTGTDAGNYSLAATTAQGAGTITHRDLTLTADAASVTQGEPLPAFTGKAQGFVDGEGGSVFGADGVTFTTTVADTNTPGSYAIRGATTSRATADISARTLTGRVGR